MAEETSKSFPEGFAFGTATAAYQIEGAWDVDGKGESIWDTFSHVRGNVKSGHTGDMACDHYNLFNEDVKLMASMGLKNYRFSISWTRIQPTGAGEVNEKGVEFYNMLIDALVANDITPLVTLYHWDLPQALEDEYGGFLSPKIVDAFEQYAEICFERFGDRVKNWITFNEPWCVCALGFGLGTHAPGRIQSPGTEPYVAAHHLLLSHARMVKLYRGSNQDGKIGITLNTDWWEPRREGNEADQAKSDRAMEFLLGWFADPIFLTGDYPEVMRKTCGDRLPTFTEEEKKMLLGSSDFFGLNHYSTHICGKGSTASVLSGLPRGLADLMHEAPSWRKVFTAIRAFSGKNYMKDIGVTPMANRREWKYTAMRWAIVPWGIRKLCLYVQNRYKPEGGIIITENGCAIRERTVEEATNPDSPKAKQRTQFMYDYIGQVHQAIEEGADVRGYFAWSFLDNFEWALGFHKRFGLVHVDYKTQKRTKKPVCEWYEKLVASNALPAYE